MLGEIKAAGELGYKGNDRRIWSACIDCGKRRWVKLNKVGSPESLRCHNCANRISATGHKGALARNWKGGTAYSAGYVFVYNPEHPQANYKGYVKRARLVLEGKLNRYLLPDEDSHHKNEIKDDDHPENLEALYRNEHRRLHAFERAKCQSYNAPPMETKPFRN